MVNINKETCIGCKKCAADCLGNYISFEENKAVIETECLQCGHCLAVCPVNAISIPEYDMADIEEYDPAAFQLDPERLLRSIKYRRSIRNYKQQPVEKEKIENLVQAGRYTATAKNNQGTRYVFVQNELAQLKELVWNNIEEIANRPRKEITKEMLPFIAFYRQHKSNPEHDYLFRNAPVVVYITSDWPLDAGLAAQNMELMAVAQDLGVLSMAISPVSQIRIRNSKNGLALRIPVSVLVCF